MIGPVVPEKQGADSAPLKKFNLKYHVQLIGLIGLSPQIIFQSKYTQILLLIALIIIKLLSAQLRNYREDMVTFSSNFGPYHDGPIFLFLFRL